MDAKTRDQINTFGDDLERYVESGVSLTRREVYIGNISQAAAIRLHKNLMLLESLNKRPITIHVNSCGGSDEAGWAMYDILRSIKCYTRAFGWGIVASMATIVMLACDERYLAPNTCFMIHEGGTVHSSGSEHIRDSISYGKESENRLEMMYDVYETHTRLKKAGLKNLFIQNKGGDVYLGVEEVVNYGFVDGILCFNDWPKQKPLVKKVKKQANKKRKGGKK